MTQKINWHAKGNVTTALNFLRGQKKISLIIPTWKELQIPHTFLENH